MKRVEKRWCSKCEKTHHLRDFHNGETVCARWVGDSKSCRRCGMPFDPSVRSGDYCSSECRNGIGEMVSYRNCVGCGAEFVVKMKYHKFCSAECRIAYNAPGLSVWRVFERDDFRCVYCGASSVEDGVKLHADHILPASKGGLSVAGNLVTACGRRNVAKLDRILSPELICRLLAVVRERNQHIGYPDMLIIKQ